MAAIKQSGLAVVVLAAGLGKRMRSAKAKVLHELRGRPMAAYVVDAAVRVAGDNVVVVVGNQADTVRRVLAAESPASISYALQPEQLGTGHAVQCALPEIADDVTHVVVLCGDTPLVLPSTLEMLVSEHRGRGNRLTLLAVDMPRPDGYGRVLLDAGESLRGIVEEADATADQRKIQTVNTGIYCLDKDFLTQALERIGCDNAQGEFYLTDVVAVGYRSGQRMGVVVSRDVEQFSGINTPRDLEKVEHMMEERLRNKS